MTLAAASLLRDDRKVPRTAVALLRMTWRSWTVLQILPRVEREELAYEKRKEQSRVTIEAQQREDAGPSAGEPASPRLSVEHSKSKFQPCLAKTARQGWGTRFYLSIYSVHFSWRLSLLASLIYFATWWLPDDPRVAFCCATQSWMRSPRMSMGSAPPLRT